MSLTRDNHYVPQWYQRLFLEPGETALAYLDMAPERRRLEDGREIVGKALFRSPPKRCFFQTDLYSTFFGTLVNDEIERKLFGAIDDRGSKAIKAFLGTDESAWHHHFQDLFEFIDVQRLRTPKGLDWLRAQYPNLNQNELMMEMQGLRNLHCAIWTEGVREIVSAEEAGTKFIISDAPVTIYNHALPPKAKLCAYPRLMAEVFGYLSRINSRSPKPNWEASIASRFVREHRQAQTLLAKRVPDGSAGRIRCAFPAGGIQDNTVNRLLLMSSSEHHLPSVPMAFFIEPAVREGGTLLACAPAR